MKISDLIPESADYHHSKDCPNYGKSGDELNELLFHGSPCTKDCSGHIAGWYWGKQHNIKEPGGPWGSSKSFDDGVDVQAVRPTMNHPRIQDKTTGRFTNQHAPRPMTAPQPMGKPTASQVQGQTIPAPVKKSLPPRKI